MARLRMILSSIWSAFLGRQEDKYYSEIIDRSYEKFSARIADVGRGLAKVAESKHRILGLITENREASQKYSNMASQFVAAGDDDKARQALDQQLYVDQVLIGLQADLDEVEHQRTELVATKMELDRQLSQFAARKEALKGRHAAAKASAEIAETMTGLSEDTSDAGQTVARMSERTKAMEAKAAGIKELMSEGALDNVFDPGQTALSRSAAAIERKSTVDERLAALKKQLEPASRS